MELSTDLISQFVRATNDDTKPTSKESTVYGTATEYNGEMWVKLDGSDQLVTPVEKTADVKEGERVTVRIKDHTAMITGNTSSPATRKEDFDGLSDDFDTLWDDFGKLKDAYNAKIDEYDEKTNGYDNEIDYYERILPDLRDDPDATIATYIDTEVLTADYIQTKILDADYIKAEIIDAEYVKAQIANVGYLTADSATIKNLEAKDANIENLVAKKATIEDLNATKAKIEDLEAENANINYATIDFANIGTAAMEKFYAGSGLIENVVVGDGVISGTLVGVTILGDYIAGNTILADKLVIKGDDGLYYKLNTSGVTLDTKANEYTRTSTELTSGLKTYVFKGSILDKAFTKSGEQVCLFTNDEGEEIVCCIVENTVDNSRSCYRVNVKTIDETTYVKTTSPWTFTYIKPVAVEDVYTTTGEQLYTFQKYEDRYCCKGTASDGSEVWYVVNVGGESSYVKTSSTWTFSSNVPTAMEGVYTTTGEQVYTFQKLETYFCCIIASTWYNVKVYPPHDEYSKTNREITGAFDGIPLEGIFTSTDEQVWMATGPSGNNTYWCEYESKWYRVNVKADAVTANHDSTNGIDGRIILADSITATQINVSDLVAFDATIGGFSISDDGYTWYHVDVEDETTYIKNSDTWSFSSTTPEPVDGAYTTTGEQVHSFRKLYYCCMVGSTWYHVDVEDGATYVKNTDTWTFSSTTPELVDGVFTTTGEQVYSFRKIEYCCKVKNLAGSIHSYAKDSAENTTRGIYFGNDGQMNIGDSKNYIRYIKGDDGTYRLNISADSISYALNGSQHSLADLASLGEYVAIGTYEGKPCIELGESDSDFKLIITNDRISFRQGATEPAYISDESLYIEKATIENELRFGKFVWKIRPSGNMGLIWEE